VKLCDCYRHILWGTEFLCKSWASHVYRSHKPVLYVNIIELGPGFQWFCHHDYTILFRPFWFTLSPTSTSLSPRWRWYWTTSMFTREKRMIMVQSLIRQSYDDDLNERIRSWRPHLFIAHDSSKFTRLPIMQCASIFDYSHANRLIKVELWKL